MQELFTLANFGIIFTVRPHRLQALCLPQALYYWFVSKENVSCFLCSCFCWRWTQTPLCTTQHILPLPLSTYLDILC